MKAREILDEVTTRLGVGEEDLFFGLVIHSDDSEAKQLSIGAVVLETLKVLQDNDYLGLESES